MSSIRITLKWSKQTFPMTIELGESALGFKQRIEALTNVPVSRQKLLAKGGWKGTLKDNAVLDALLLKRNTTSPSKNMVVTLIGSAETLSEPTQKTTFMEDLSPQDLEAAEEAEAQAAMATAQGVIAAIQLPPHRRDDHKQELYQYNRLVTGLPQRQIEQELKYGQGASADGQLEGKVAMTLGLELRRAYVNDIIVLKDGTCVSALDDGHVQLWKHAAQHEDVVHQGIADGGVDNIVALNQKETAFATAGRGTLQFWTADGEPVASVRTAMPGTTPASLVEVPVMGDDEITCLAARFRVTRGTNPMQFRLPPQNDSERQRRAQAEAQEQAIQQALSGAARSVQVWFSIGQTKLQSRILEPSDGMEGSAVVTCLATLAGTDDRDPVLVVGDAAGGLRLWRVQRNNGTLEFNQQGLYQLLSPTSGCAVSCLKSLQDGRLAVSTGSSNEAANTHDLMGATKIEVPTARAVHILDFSYSAEPRVQTTLSGHTDEVITMCELPNGDLLTGGGKFDATLQLWSRSQLEPPTDSEGTAHEVTKSQKTLSNVGYVFALTVLPDAKNDSTYYAVAAARYNTVKVVI